MFKKEKSIENTVLLKQKTERKTAKKHKRKIFASQLDFIFFSAKKKQLLNQCDFGNSKFEKKIEEAEEKSVCNSRFENDHILSDDLR